MSVTSGFFNSLNGDRKYSAEQMSAIFNGIINDGVFASVGTAFGVKAGTENTITVGVGRAWFDGTWLYNDNSLTLIADDSELILNRYDAVVIEIDHSDSVRNGDIKIVKGTPGSSPSKPEMVHTAYVNQYPLAYIYRAAGSSAITQGNIENVVGTSACPYVTGILQVLNIDNIVAQWQGQWDDWRGQWDQWEALWNEWFLSQTGEVEADTEEWLAQMQTQFSAWFESLQVVLDGDVAANLTAIAVDLQNRFHILATERAVYEDMQDSNGDDLQDSYGNVIEGKTFMGGSDGSLNEADIQTLRTEIGTKQNKLIGAEGQVVGFDSHGEAVAIDARPKTVTVSLKASGWSGGTTQTVEVNGILADETKQLIQPVPSELSQPAYIEAGILCSSQSTNHLTFKADKTPSDDLTVYVVIQEVSV